MNLYEIKPLDGTEVKRKISAETREQAWKHVKEVLCIPFFTLEQIEDNRYNKRRYE